MKRNTTKLALILVAIVAVSQAIQLPQCQASSFFKTLPLVPNESFIMNLDSFFGGYNLQYTTEADDLIKNYITLNNKFWKQKQQFPEEPMAGLKSHHISKFGNSWGQQFITLSEKAGKVVVHYGILNDNTTVPVINNFIVVVEDRANTSCFDAVLFPFQDRIIVDCVEKRAVPNSKGQIYENVFYYYKISNGAKIRTLKTEMFIPFKTITKRKIDIYTGQLNKHTFLVRTYLSQGMIDSNMDNTYVELFMIDDPDDPWIVGVIDRSFLQVPKLRVMDAKIYLGKIYILDYLKGVHQVEITASEDLNYVGLYEAKGFRRLAVFSSNLDNYLEFALANDHSVHEVDWSEVETPRLLNKYSLMPDSIVTQVFINTRFVFVQSSSVDNNVVYNYTWILNRGDRTFSRAFKVLKHNFANTLIDLNQELTYLLVMSQQGIANYAFDQPNLVLTLNNNPDLLDRLMSFKIKALSFDPNNLSQNVSCQVQVNFTLLDEYNRTMWPIGSAPPDFYNANYPGKIKIDLFEYVVGPNITYRIKQTQKDQLNKSKVFQQEQLNITWKDSPPFENITFLQTRTIHGPSRDTLIIYMQDKDNITYISYCYPDHEELGVVCNKTETKDVGGRVTNWATTIYYSPYTQSNHHVLAYSTEKYYNTIFIEDLSYNLKTVQFNLGRSFPGNISSLTITDKYMYVVLKYIKRVNIYSLQECLKGQQYCNKKVSFINHENMYHLGVKYFAPQSVHSSPHHPNVIFVKTADSIIIVDLSKENIPNLLATVKPVESHLVDFVFEVNQNFMVITIAPNIIQEYDLSRLYLKEVKRTKNYPLYGYKLPKNYEFDLSDYGSCVYLETVSEGGVYNIFVYRSGYPAIGSLYTQINLFSYQNVLVDASGYIVDYVTVVAGKELRIFRQYQYPLAEIINPKEDYKFYLEYYNLIESAVLQMVSVKIINLPTYIHVNPFLNNIMNTKDLLYSGQNRLNQINDTDWYEGNVLYIKPTCHDCGTKIKIYNHIQEDGVTAGAAGMTDYVYTQKGGAAQTIGGLVSFRHNGTIGQIVTFPENAQKRCIEIESGLASKLYISGCVSQESVSIYLTSYVGDKPFAMLPYETQASNLFKLQSTNELIMLVDTEQSAYRKTSKGGIFIYELNGDDEQQQPLIQLEYLDGQDFGMRELGDIYINNAELTYNKDSGTYRLYISQMTKGLFMVEFTHKTGRPDIIIKQIVYIDLKKMLSDLKETLPYDATFQAIALISSTIDSSKQITENLLVTTGRYNTIQLAVKYSQSSTILSKKITRIYLRYSYYEITNHISHTNELFLIKHTIPDDLKLQNQTQQLYTVYSTRDVNRTDLQKRGLIGAYPINDNKMHKFDFNLTLDPNDQHSQPRVGIVIVQSEHDTLQKATLHRNLSLFTSELLDTQIIYIDLINDFNLQKIRILINGIAPYPEWKLITIILFSAIGALLLLGGAFVGFKKWKEGQGALGQERETLMTQGEQN